MRVRGGSVFFFIVFFFDKPLFKLLFLEEAEDTHGELADPEQCPKEDDFELEPIVAGWLRFLAVGRVTAERNGVHNNESDNTIKSAGDSCEIPNVEER